MSAPLQYDACNERNQILRAELHQRLSPQQLLKWNQRRPSIAVRDSLCCWFFIAAAWGLVSWRLEWWSLLIAIVVIGNRYYGLFVIGHDALHRRVFANVLWNDLFADLVIFGPIGAITRINNRNHLIHHRRLGQSDDPDRHKYECFNKATAIAMMSYAIGISSVSRSVWNVFVARHYDGLSDHRASSEGGYTFRDISIMMIWQISLFAGLTWFIGWWSYFVLWWIPVYIFTFLCDNLRSFLEHSRPVDDGPFGEHRLINYCAPWWETIWLAPFCMNYHATHHLFPSIPYYNLAVADSAIRPIAEVRGVEWRSSYCGYLWQYLRRLPLRKCQAEQSLI